jgi:hypothetical protein
MTEENELLNKVALCLLSFAALLWRERRRGDKRHAGPMLTALAVVAIIASRSSPSTGTPWAATSAGLTEATRVGSNQGPLR